MQTRTRRALIVTVIVVIVGLLAWYLSRPQPVAVTVAVVERGRVETTVANTRAGTVKAPRRAKIAPIASGQVTTLTVHEGDRVEAGALLLEVWNDDLKAQLRLAESQASSAHARADDACLRADMAEREAQRLVKLRPQGLTSEESVDRAVTESKAAAAACRAARAEIQVAEDQVTVARTALERTQLRAPFSGVVAEVNAELGEVVTPSPPGIPTPPAVDLIDPSLVLVSAPIDEVDAPEVRLGMPARISLDAFTDRTFEGSVTRIAPYVLDVEKQARTVEVEVTFADSAKIPGLLPGYSADVEIIVDAHDDVLRVPTEAVLEGPRVLVVDDDDVLESRPITKGLSNWRYTEIASGLAEGERVVLSVNREGVQAGADVTVEQNAEAAR